MKVTDLSEQNIILRSLEETKTAVQLNAKIPPGYLEIRLSTKGKLGAPDVFHIRNFKVSDIVSLSLSSDSDIPGRLAQILNDMIWEDTDVNQWHEKEVEELMVCVFKTFYKDTLDGIPFPLRSEDYDIFKDDPEKLEALTSKKWVPTTSISIGRDTETYDIPDNFSAKIKIKNKQTGFYLVFDYIKYGDQLILKKWLDDYFSEEERKFKNFKDQIKLNSILLKQVEKNPESINKIIPYDAEEEKAYNDYLQRRLQTLSELIRIISIVDYNGQDVSALSLTEKYELIKDDARIDFGLVRALNKKQQALKFGIKPEVNMKNPLTGEVVKRPFSFRVLTILQAIQLSGDDVYDDGDDDEN